MPDTRQAIQRKIKQIERLSLRAIEVSHEYEWVTRQIQWAVRMGQMAKNPALTEAELQVCLAQVEEARVFMLDTLEGKRRFHAERERRKFL